MTPYLLLFIPLVEVTLHVLTFYRVEDISELIISEGRSNSYQRSSILKSKKISFQYFGFFQCYGLLSEIMTNLKINSTETISSKVLTQGGS